MLAHLDPPAPPSFADKAPIPTGPPPRPVGSSVTADRSLNADRPPTPFEFPARLRVMAWNDDERDLVGHDPRSVYVERFWLGTLGPSSTWLLRTLAYGLEAAPTGFVMECASTARMLGLGERFQRNSAFAKAVDRLTLFHLALTPAPGEIAVRRFVPWLTRRNVVRLPVELQHEHLAWEAQRLGPAASGDEHRRRAAQLAQSMARMGDDVAAVERGLAQMGFHPALCRPTAEWAWDQVHAEPEEGRGLAAP